MRRSHISRRTALGVIAGAVAAPGLARAQQATEVRAIIQYGVSYLPLMMIEEEKLLGAVLAEQGDARIELKLQRTIWRKPPHNRIRVRRRLITKSKELRLVDEQLAGTNLVRDRRRA